MRKFAVAGAVLLLLAGCTSGSGSGSSTSTSTTDPGTKTTLDPVEVAKAPGVTDTTIKLGITYVDLAAIANVVDIDHGDYEGSFKAVIDDINQRGGINGRKIEPVFAPINPIGTQPAEAACLKLTEDEKVFAITGFFLGDAALCPLETHDTAVLGGEMNPERLQRAKAPWFTLEPSADLQTDGVKALDKAGLLDGKVAVFAIATDTALLNDSVKPLLADLGIKPVATAILDTPQNDVPAGLAQTAVIAQRFKTAGATKVLVVGNGGVIWLQGTEKTSYRPQDLFVVTNTILAYTQDSAGKDLSVLDGAKAADVFGPKPAQFAEADMARCLKVIRDAGVPIGNPTPKKKEADGTAQLIACRYMSLFEQLATKAGKDLNYATFRAAAAELGDIKLPAAPDPYHFGAPPHADGDPAVYIYDWKDVADGFQLAS